MNSLEFNEVSFGYGKNPMIKKMSAKVNAGDLVVILGKNGVGKTTLFKTILGLIPALDGEIRINKKPIEQYSRTQLAQLFSVVFSKQANAPKLSVKKMLTLGRIPYHNYDLRLSELEKKQIQNAIDLTGIQALQNQLCYELSEGQLQKAMIARALVQNTPFVLLDEPTAHLDLENQCMLYNLIAKLKQNTNKTFLFITHQVEPSLSLANQLWWIENGQVVAGKTESVALEQNIYEKLTNNHLTFDFKQERLVKPMEQDKFIGFESNNSSLSYWVKHALERLGYTTNTNIEEEKVLVQSQQIIHYKQGAKKTYQNLDDFILDFESYQNF